MKHTLSIIILLLSLCIKVEGQSLSKTDSLKIEEAVNQVFKNMAKPNYSNFKAVSLDSIRCAICEGFDKYPQLIGRIQFFTKNLKSISNHDLWKRASKRANQVFIVENKPYSDVTVLFQTYKAGEIAQGHEGAQLGLWFKKHNNKFKLAGIETIP